jgi:hypothetical protein
MSEAVHTARQDLQLRKAGGTEVKQSGRVKPTTASTRESHTKIINSAEYLSRMQRRHQRNMQVNYNDEKVSFMQGLHN